MKKNALLLILIYWVGFATAQNQYATISSGQQVILKPDGTWTYVKESTTTSRSNNSNNLNTQTSRQSSHSTKSTIKSSQGRSYIRGPRGGCYYINRNGNKTYVDRSLCQ